MTDHSATALDEELDALGVVTAPRSPITAERTTGRGWAYLGALLGGAVSIAANVAHSYVPPPGATPGWTPERGAVIGAMFWPFALFVAIEILARTAWPAGRRWVALRFAGLLPVAVVAAVVSYRHLSGLLAFYGEDPLTATIGPLAVDGLMVMATGALIASGARRLAAGPARVQPSHSAARDVAGPVTVPGPAENLPTARPLPADPAPTPAADTGRAPARRPAPRRPGRTDTGTAVRRLRERHPEMSVAEIARRLAVTDRTVRRHLNTTPAPTPTPTTDRAVPASAGVLPAAA
jgi:DNA-binding transcriptional ArsR family regulator